MKKKMPPLQSSLSSVFHHPEMEELIRALPYRGEQDQIEEFIALLKKADLSNASFGNDLMKEQMKKGAHLNGTSPFVALATVLRAYPQEAKNLILWAHGEKKIEQKSKNMEFFAMFGLLYERATRPADFIYEGTGLDIPLALNRLQSNRQEALQEAQRGFWGPR